jgi:type III restriction enzyme
MNNRLRAIDEESKDAEDPEDRTAYALKFTVAVCEKIVCRSLEKANVTSGRVIDANRQRFLQALGTLRRKATRSAILQLRI